MVGSAIVKTLQNKIDLLIFSDFNYGVLPQELVNKICKLFENTKVIISADSQSSSQIGNISRYKDMNLITATEREARISLGLLDEGVEWVANTLMKKTNSRNLVMKLGREGFIAYESEKDGFVNRQHFPALSINPVDVSGAGDSLLAALSVGLCSGATLMQSSAIGAGMRVIMVRNRYDRTKVNRHATWAMENLEQLTPPFLERHVLCIP